jgi:hypothetical protein
MDTGSLLVISFRAEEEAMESKQSTRDFETTPIDGSPQDQTQTQCFEKCFELSTTFQTGLEPET